ncbi:hypothetical protein AWC11_03335 [Mycobacterium interjectum]|nr:hypothetical protein AWC11_03335 [Mycobacterium interjectum]
MIELPAVEWQTYFTPVDREVTGQDGNTHERQEREWNPPPGAPLGNDRASASLLCDSDDFPSTLKLVGKNINNLLAAYTLNLTQIEQVEGLLHKTLRTLGKRKAELNPPMPKLGDKPGRKQTPAVEPWDESSWQPEKINESKRLVKLNDMMWNTLDGLDDTEGEMLKRIGKSILDFIEDENKVRGVARLMHSVIEFASVYKSKRR